jgi:hypothetical protein
MTLPSSHISWPPHAANGRPATSPTRTGGGLCESGVKVTSAGFSVIEATIASALLLIVAIGLLPMFTVAIGNNQQGRDSMEITNLARSEIERMTQLAFTDAELTVPDGETVLTTESYYVSDTLGWVLAADYDDEGYVYHRIVSVRQFDADALTDGLLHPDEAIEGDDDASVHFKEILVEMESAGGIGAPPKQVALRAIRAV